MYPHHLDTIENVKKIFLDNKEVLAVLLGGSLAHGFGKETSDVDIMLVISEEDYCKRRNAGQLLYWDDTLSTYEGGYVDGKYISIDFMRKVRDCGSEPARFAYKDAQIILSRMEGLSELLAEIVGYPVAGKELRMARFYAQLQAWRWYCGEATRHENIYLLNTAVAKLILFGGRLILTHNEILYPYHKWFLRVLSEAKEKPEGLMNQINCLSRDASMQNVEAFYKSIDEYRDWVSEDVSWGQYFMDDIELNWLSGHTPVDDL